MTGGDEKRERRLGGKGRKYSLVLTGKEAGKVGIFAYLEGTRKLLLMTVK